MSEKLHDGRSLTEPTPSSQINAWLVRLSDHASLDAFSATLIGRSNGGMAVEEGDGCVLLDVKGNSATAIAGKGANPGCRDNCSFRGGH